MMLFSLASPYFLTIRNLTNIVTQNTYFIIAAVGLSFVMIGGGIDLSVGYQMSLVGVITAMLMVLFNFPVWAAVNLGFAARNWIGHGQRADRHEYKVFPLIVTLATSTVFQGISYLVSQAQTYRNYPEEFLFIPKAMCSGCPLMSS